MKKLLYPILLIPFFSKAQDTIIVKDNTRSVVKVTEINEENIFYKRTDNIEGPTYSMRKANIRYIIYANGFRENIDSAYAKQAGFTSENKPSASGKPSDQKTASKGDDMYYKGVMDAKTFYTHHGGSFGVYCASAGCGLLGLIPAIAVSNAQPKPENLRYPRKDLWENENYRLGYRTEAHKIKKKRVWSGFGAGIATAVLVGIIIQQ